jgi:hypothetical protein
VPWDLTPRQRQLLNLSGRRLVQLPPAEQKALADKRVNGVKLADLILLAALRDLAEQGNVVALEFANRLAARLEIDRSTYFHGRN